MAPRASKAGRDPKHEPTPQLQSGKSNEPPKDEVIAEDDLCAICHALLYNPVTTRCHHTLCASCLNLWAEISINQQMAIVGLDDQPMTLHPSELEIKCPMCRTLSTGSPDTEREASLRARYPQTYLLREEEERAAIADDFAESVETLTLYIGNTHQLVKQDDGDDSPNKHKWKFFVRPSRNDLIEEVHVFLHPTFRNHRVIVQFAPYEIHRLGWGYFTIYVNVILRPGYSWMSSEAEDAPDGGRKGKLPLEWTLDFNGRGSQGRLRLKVKKEKEGQESEGAAQRDRVYRLWRRQRDQDPDWVEPDQ